MRLTVLSVGYPLAPISAATAGGAEQILAILDEALVETGHRSLVIAPESSRCRGLLLPTQMPSGELTDIAQAQARAQHREAVRQALDRFSIDVVHMHGLDFYHYLPEDGPPVVVTLHLPLAWYPAVALKINRAKIRLVCVSRSQMRDVPGKTADYDVVENGVRLLADNPPRRKRKPGYLLSLGRICPEKGFHLAMDAARDAGLSLWLAGTVFAYPAHKKYFEQMILPRLREGHRYLGQVGGKHKLDLIAGASCLLVPSQVAETSCLVAMEAFACGVPVVAFRRGALREIIGHGRTGFLVDSVPAMTQAILMAERIHPETCRAAARAHFSSEVMVARYLRIYEDVMREKISDAGTERESWPSLAA